MFEILSHAQIHALIASYGLFVLFAVVMGESMGVPLPGETALITAALYGGTTHRLGIFPVVLVAAAGAFVGDNIGYLIGRSLGLPLLVRYGRYVRLDEDRLRVGQYLFLRHGGKIVFFGRFIAFLRAFAALLAGANRMVWTRFVLFNGLGGLCWASLVGFSAYLFGENIKHIVGPVSGALLIAVGGLLLAAVLFFRRHEKELEDRARAAIPEIGN